MRSLLVGSVALLLCTACPPKQVTADGSNSRPVVEAKADPKADVALADAKHKADTGTRKQAIDAFFSVRKAFPETVAGQEALYRAGVLAFEEGDWVTARKALGELVFENPLHPNANDARLKVGLAALELKQFRDAYQTLQPLVEKLEGQQKLQAQDALAKAAAANQQYGETLKLALKSVESSAEGQPRADALKALEDTIENRVSFLSIVEQYQELSSSHPGWPMLTFKLARIYFHLRDWQRLDESLKALLKEAPASPYAAPAKEMLARTAKRFEVKPKVVGAVLPMTGKYKALGEAVARGLNLALKGSDIELVVKDSQGDVNLAGKLVEELALDEGAIAIIGPLLGDDSRRAALVAEELQVPIITMTRADGITRIGPHVFRNMLTNAQQADALVAYAMDTLNYKTFAVMYPNIPFGVEVSNAFWDAVERRGGTIRGAENYDHDQTTFAREAKELVGRYWLEDRAEYLEQFRAVKEQGLDDFRRRKAMEKVRKDLVPVIDFEALLIPDTWQRVSLIAPALASEDVVTNACDKKDLEKIQKATGKDKLKTVTLLGTSTWSSPKGQSGDPQLIERGGKYVNCAVYVDGFYEGSKRPATKAFVDAFKEANKEFQPTLLDAVGFDTAGMLRQVLEKDPPKSRASLRDRLAGLRDFDGATGLTSFTDEREATKPLFYLSIEPNKGVKEKDAPVAKSKPEG